MPPVGRLGEVLDGPLVNVTGEGLPGAGRYSRQVLPAGTGGYDFMPGGTLEGGFETGEGTGLGFGLGKLFFGYNCTQCMNYLSRLD